MLLTARPTLAPIAVLACGLLVACATIAAAHCCHDERDLGAASQSGLRSGVHGMGGGLEDEPLQRNPPSVGDGLGSNTAALGGGGVGQLHGNSIGNYGAGSLGERGPGGLGTLQGGSIVTQPPRPR